MAQMPPDDLIRLMVGRALENHFPELPPVAADAPVVLDVRGVSSASGVRVNDVAFQVHAGEIVGLAGLVGAGRTEIVRAIAGADVPTKGEIAVDGKRVVVRSPRSAIAAGIALITEDRKAQGLVLGMTRAREHDARAPRAVRARHVHRQAGGDDGRRTRRSPSCASARRRRSKPCATFPAATSRRSCSRSG